MPEIYQNENFEMSVVTKRFWLYTRKFSNQYGGVTLPGLFQTRQYTFDLFLFIVIITCEIIGIINLQRVGQFNIIFVFSLFLADILFAIFAHLPKGKICRIKNQLILAEEAEEISRLKKQKKIRVFISSIFKLLIVGLALFKVLGFYFLHGTFNGLSFLICLTYAVAAFLHIYATGYFLWETLVIIRVAFEHNKFLSIDKKTQNPYKTEGTFPHGFESKTPLNPATVNRHSLIQDPESADKYILNTFGILTDRDLQNLIAQQSSRDQKSKLASECLRHQLIILDTDPMDKKDLSK